MHWLNNLLFCMLGFGTAFICFGCAALVMAADKKEENYKNWRIDWTTYALYNGPNLLLMHEELCEVIKEKRGLPDYLRPFLTIAKKENGYWKKLDSQEMETKVR